MSGTAQQILPTAADRRPTSVRVLLTCLCLLGVTACIGGVELVAGIGAGAAMPPSYLDNVPLIGSSMDSWLVPGLVLGIGFGLGSLITGTGMLRRSRLPGTGWVERLTGQHWSWLATIVIGAGQAVWILLEVLYIPDLSPVQALYGPLGLLMALLPLRGSVRRHLPPAEPT
jgi:hypothetical protein